MAVLFWMLPAMWFLPAVQKVIDPKWILIPALLMFLFVFTLIGVVMKRFAYARIERGLAEAAVWERKRMVAESEAALNAAVACFGSFLLSPSARKPYYDKLLTRASQHRLAHGGTEIAADPWVLEYLDRFPEDEEAAQVWIQTVLKAENLPFNHSDIVLKLLKAQPENKTLLRLSGHFFLSQKRTDFEALQLYRRALTADEYTDSIFLNKLAQLLTDAGFRDEWALDIYLKAYTNAPDSPEVLKAILSCVQKLGDHERNRPLLVRARDLLNKWDAERTRLADAEKTILTAHLPKTLALSEAEKTLAVAESKSEKTVVVHEKEKALLSAASEETLIPTQLSATMLLSDKFSQKKRKFKRAGSAPVSSVMESGWNRLTNLAVNLKHSNPGAIFRWVAVSAICSGILFFVVNIIVLLSQERPLPKKTPLPIQVEEKNSPFTLQVAAYLNQSEAEKYMQKLKQMELNAYLTEAQGSDKKWYQVRIAHFDDPKEAKIYGENLKSKGIINDYYVAVFKPPIAQP